MQLHLTLPLLAATVAVAAPAARAADPARPHELGWLCVNVSDLNVTQVSGFNRDAPVLSITVGKGRLYTEPAASGGPGGRVCAPTVVRAGDGEAPAETLFFERGLAPQAKAAAIELVVVPDDPRLAEATVSVVAIPSGWSQREGTWTYQIPGPLTFAERPVRSLVGDGDGPPPDSLFPALLASQRFAEPCQPVALSQTAPANFGVYDPRLDRVTARGIEPLTIPAGTRVSRCEGLSLDPLMVAVARPADEGDTGAGAAWFLVPHDTPMGAIAGLEDVRYTSAQPLGGYHVCRQPGWATATLEDIALGSHWELERGQGWRQMPLDPSESPLIPAGTAVELLDTREGWAVIEGRLPPGPTARPRVIAVKASAVALPSGGGHAVLAVGGGLCPVARGQWRATKSNVQAFRVSQDTPGAELAGLWLELPIGTQVLQLCQDARSTEGISAPKTPACSPVYVGGAQGSPQGADRFVLVRYAATWLGVREDALRERTTGEFALRAERPWFWRAGAPKVEDEPDGWVFSLGPGARLGFADADDHAWVLKSRLQRLTDDALGFEGGFGVGGDGLGTFIELTAGLGKLFYTFPDVPFELRGGVIAKLDFYTSGDQGLGFDVIAKAQLRWVNDTLPVNLELGLNLGYGGTFGPSGEGHFRFGMPVSLVLELARF
ncbi:MAG: hypothetical protein IT385_07410 [Deltaproteobacteria bacterium]|nr:hypothetical protein [Deltaproteobacteria bacterium]